MKRPFRHTTVPRAAPPAQRARPSAPKRRHERTLPPARTVARIIDTSDHSLLDVIDNLLNQGVVLNADLVLALADVDLVFVRLSALLCAADRILRPTASRRRPSRRAQTKIERQL